MRNVKLTVLWMQNETLSTSYILIVSTQLPGSFHYSHRWILCRQEVRKTTVVAKCLGWKVRNNLFTFISFMFSPFFSLSLLFLSLKPEVGGTSLTLWNISNLRVFSYGDCWWRILHLLAVFPFLSVLSDKAPAPSPVFSESLFTKHQARLLKQ